MPNEIDDDTEEYPQRVSLYELLPNEATDRWNLAFLIFFGVGIGTLLPWNFFINAQSYFNYRLRNTSVPEDIDFNHPDFFTEEQRLFLNYVGLCSMLPLALATMSNFVLTKCISSFIRFSIGAILMVLMFLGTVIVVNIDVDPMIFLAITLSSVVLINIGAAFFQSSCVGIAAVLPPRCMKACVEGQAVAGIVATVSNIITIAVASDPKTNAIVYFSIALVYVTFATFLFFSLKCNTYFEFYWDRKNEIKATVKTKASEEVFDHGDRVKRKKGSTHKFFRTIREVLLPGICILLTFLATLSVFPGVLVHLKPMEIIPEDPWTTKYFVPVVVFLSFNVCDWLGRFIAGFVRWPRRHQMKLLLVFVLIRLVLVPLCMFCNEKPRFILPVVFGHDAIPIVLVILLGLTNGYVMTIAMMHGPSLASPGNSESAGIALTVFLVLGLCSGVAVSIGLVTLL